MAVSGKWIPQAPTPRCFIECALDLQVMHCPSESLKGTQLPRSADSPHLYFHTIYGYCEMLTPPHAAWAGASLSFIQIWDEDAFSTARWQPCLPTQSGSTAEAKSAFVPNAALIFLSCWTPKLRGHAGHFKVIWLISENHNLSLSFFFFFGKEGR